MRLAPRRKIGGRRSCPWQLPSSTCPLPRIQRNYSQTWRALDTASSCSGLLRTPFTSHPKKRCVCAPRARRTTSSAVAATGSAGYASRVPGAPAGVPRSPLRCGRFPALARASTGQSPVLPHATAEPNQALLGAQENRREMHSAGYGGLCRLQNARRQSPTSYAGCERANSRCGRSRKCGVN